MKYYSIIYIINLFILCVNSNIFTTGLRKGLGYLIGESGCKESTMNSNHGLSSSKSSNKNQNDEFFSEKEGYLNAKIIGLSIGISPLGFNLAMENSFIGLIKNGFGYRGILPCYLGGCTFKHHASSLLYTNKGYILLEYGGYFGQDERYNEKIFYYYDKEGGIRFSHMNYRNFVNLVTNNGEYSEKDKIINDIEIENEMTLKELIEKISYKMDLKADDYNLADNNCHDLVAYIVYFLKAKRNSKIAKAHNFSKLMIPPKILEALEENENNLITTLEKIPVVGFLFDMGEAFFG